MSVPIVSGALFCFAFAVHWVTWQAWRPKASGQVLVSLLVVSIIIAAGVLISLSLTSTAVGGWLPARAGEWLQAIVLALAISASYVMTYPAVECESPTLVIVDAIARRGPEGLELNDLYRDLSDDFLVMARVNDLCNESLAIETDGRFALTQRGRFLARVFMSWRTLLRLGRGG